MIFRNRSLGTATSANWKVTYRPCLTTFAAIFTSFSGSVVGEIVGQGVKLQPNLVD
jgi:hypothetical protein